MKCVDWSLRLLPRSLVAIALWMLMLFPMPAEGEDVQVPESAAGLKSTSRAELDAAVNGGTVLSGRLIRGADVVDVLARSIGHGPCNSHSALRVEHSIVDGDIVIPEPPAGDDKRRRIRRPKDPSEQPKISIPISIRRSSLRGGVTLSKVRVGCSFDLTGSTVEGPFFGEDTIFDEQVVADNAVFRRQLEFYGAEWRGTASFHGARFMGNAEFLPHFDSDDGLAVTFQKDVDFEEAVFQRFANFIDVRFGGPMNFRTVEFRGEANFGGARMGPGTRKPSGPFYDAEFKSGVTFQGAQMHHLTFWRTMFRGRTGFERVRADSLTFFRVAFHGQTDFSDSNIGALEFKGWLPVEEVISFRRAKFDTASFYKVLFAKDVDFEGATLGSRIGFDHTSFQGDAHFEDAVFPHISKPREASMFRIEDTVFGKGLYADRHQLLVVPPWWSFWRDSEPAFVLTSDTNYEDDPSRSASDHKSVREVRSWRELQRAFESAGNLEMANFALFELRRSDAVTLVGWRRLADVVSRWFWGYGVRPFRVLIWLGVAVLMFAFIYQTQLACPDAVENRFLSYWLRWKQALIFSARTAWAVKFGYTNSRTMIFRIVTVGESLLAKAFLTLFIYSISKTSPLLNELMKRLLP